MADTGAFITITSGLESWLLVFSTEPLFKPFAILSLISIADMETQY